MSQLQEKIQAAAKRNGELLEGLREVDGAPERLHHTTNYISDLDAQIVKSEKHVKLLKGRTNADLENHKKYSESTFRRFAYKASGRKERFAEKASKEEKDYFDALQAQKTAEDDLSYAKQLKAEAEINKSNYESQAQKHDVLQKELDDLYNSIFAGYTPELPDEDAKERSVHDASQKCAQINHELEKERHVLRLLSEVKAKLITAHQQLDDASDLSRMDMWGGGSMWSMMKRNTLEQAQSTISQVGMLQNQIRSIKPDIGDLGPMDIDSGSIWSDVIFDNIFTDMDMHDKIKSSQAQLDKVIQAHSMQAAQAEHRERLIMNDMDQASNALQNARKELQQTREDAFVKVARGDPLQGPSSTAPGSAGFSSMARGSPLPSNGETTHDHDDPPPAYEA